MSLRDKDYKLAIKFGIIEENTKDKYQCMRDYTLLRRIHLACLSLC